jgi:hypothetical protein
LGTLAQKMIQRVISIKRFALKIIQFAFSVNHIIRTFAGAGVGEQIYIHLVCNQLLRFPSLDKKLDFSLGSSKKVF